MTTLPNHQLDQINQLGGIRAKIFSLATFWGEVVPDYIISKIPLFPRQFITSGSIVSCVNISISNASMLSDWNGRNSLENPGVPNQSPYHCQQKDPQLPEPPVIHRWHHGVCVGWKLPVTWLLQPENLQKELQYLKSTASTGVCKKWFILTLYYLPSFWCLCPIYFDLKSHRTLLNDTSKCKFLCCSLYWNTTLKFENLHIKQRFTRWSFLSNIEYFQLPAGTNQEQ